MVGVAEPLPEPGGRRIVTFARTDARVQRKDQLTLDRYGADYVLDIPRSVARAAVHPDYRMDVEALWGRRAPLIVEIGAGSGDATTAAGQAYPDHNVLGLEVYKPGLIDMLRKVGSRDLRNVRMVDADAVTIFESALPPASVREVWTFFPDPWPKTKHHKRRIVAPAFADLVATVLESGGRWRLATDWADYAAQMRGVLTACPWFDNPHADAPGGRAPRFEVRPLTRFERRGVAEGREIHDFTFVRNDRPVERGTWDWSRD